MRLHVSSDVQSPFSKQDISQVKCMGALDCIFNNEAQRQKRKWSAWQRHGQGGKEG